MIGRGGEKDLQKLKIGDIIIEERWTEYDKELKKRIQFKKEERTGIMS